MITMNSKLLSAKLDLIQWLSTVEDSSIIEKLQSIRNEGKNNTWPEVSEEEILSINKGLQDADEEKITAHSDVKSVYDKWL